MQNKTIMIVEDDRIVAEGTKRSLIKLGYNVSGIASYGEKAFEKAKECHPDLVLMDIMLKGGVNGTVATYQIQTQLNIPVVYLTAYTDKELLNRAKKTEPFGYIVKPYEERELNTAIEIALYKHKMETKLKESEAYLYTTLRSIADAVITFNIQCGVTFMNTAAQNLTEWDISEAAGKPVTDIFNIINEQTRDDVEIPVANILFKGLVAGLPNNTILKTKNGQEISIDDSCAPIKDDNGNITGAVLIFRDIRERKNAENENIKLGKQLMQTQKMEAIGTLAGGIAHDFNNMLSIILGCSELAMAEIPEQHPAKYHIKQIKTAILKSSDIIKQLVNFIRPTNLKREPVKINPIIEDCLDLLISAIPNNIEILRTIPDDSEIVLADPTQIHQVIMNLCTNAAHAMSENEGVLEISLSVIAIGKNGSIQNLELNHGQYVMITVRDTGHGITKEHLDKIFDPYFTTKEIDEGSGIGLSVVQGIVKSHEGVITVDSVYGKGTTFNVFLPVYKKGPESKDKIDTTIPKGTERVLFIDDEKIVVDITSLMLEQLGYTVTTKTSGTNALETFRLQPDKFDLIISDMVMPEIMGDKLAKIFQSVRPDIPIILCTGFSKYITDEKAKSLGIKAFITKPIEFSELARIIRHVLDES